MKQVATWIGFLLGAGGLLLQAYSTFTLRTAQGHDLLGTIVFFFTFYTILTNIMLVLVYLSEISAARWLGWWRSPVTRGMMAGAIALVGIFNHLLLADLQDLTGLAAFCDLVLHYLTPAYFVLWWLILQPKVELNLYGKDDPQRGVAAGLSDVEAGLRLRYEFSRKFAPYVGVEWTRRYGDRAAAPGLPAWHARETSWVAGVRMWF